MAERLVTLGRYGEAEDWVRRAAAVYPHPGVVHFRVGQQLLVHDQSASAISHFQQSLAIDPGQPIVEYALGETYLDGERPREAIPHLRRALEAGVRPDQAGYDLVRALGAVGDRDGALRVLRTVTPARPDDAERWLALGQLGLQLQEPGLAETFLRRAVSTNKALAAAHSQLGLTLNLEHRWTEATIELEEAVRLSPREADPHIGLAVANANLGRLADARVHILEALRLDPASEVARRVQEALK